MESRIGTNINEKEKFTSYLDDLIQNYFVIQKIIIVATTDVLKNKFLNFFIQDQLVCDTIKILQKIAKARYLDSLLILKKMLSDKLSGLSDKEIEDKEYEYTAEFFYYTKKEYVPTDDPRWSTLKIHNVDDLLDKEKNILIKSKIIENA